MTNYIKVINTQVFTLSTKMAIPDERLQPFLRMEMEDGRQFIMSSIPTDIAYQILFENSKRTGSSKVPPDPRMQIYNLVGELAIIEKTEIDLIVPGTDVYQATIYLLPEGFSNHIQYQMIPSHAVLLSIANDAPIYVADTLISAADAYNEQ
ncbi:MAG: hypothetical protein INQ03_15165 [Candidatus Heimdallarchaeota archaeon]|nr:hypothetical protein [Candidatus Heimdallarchaeota archaeon]